MNDPGLEAMPVKLLASPAPLSEEAADSLRRALSALGLTPYQARVLLALLRLECGTCIDIALLAGVPRTSIYQVLEELAAKDLACRLPGPGPAVWTSVGHREALVRLVATEERRLGQLKVRSARVRELMHQLLPKDGAVAPAQFVHVIHDPGRIASLYEQLLAQTEEELLVLDQPPSFSPVGRRRSVMLDVCRRVPTRVLYQRAAAAGPAGGAWRSEMEAYQGAGAQGRVVDKLPIMLAVFDRRRALLSMGESLPEGDAAPTTLLVEHPQFAASHAVAFDAMWARAEAYQP